MAHTRITRTNVCFGETSAHSKSGLCDRGQSTQLFQLEEMVIRGLAGSCGTPWNSMDEIDDTYSRWCLSAIHFSSNTWTPNLTHTLLSRLHFTNRDKAMSVGIPSSRGFEHTGKWCNMEAGWPNDYNETTDPSADLDLRLAPGHGRDVIKSFQTEGGQVERIDVFK